MVDARETKTHQQPLPDFDEFRNDTSIVRRITDIHRFIFTVFYQKGGAIADPAAREALLTDGYEVLNDLFEQSGIHYLHSLEAKTSTPSADVGGDNSEPLIEFQFSHDTQHCRFQFFADRFTIARGSSSFADFYAWYSIVMPEAVRIEMTFRQIVQRSTHRTLRPVQSNYEFQFYFSNFKIPEQIRKLRGLPSGRESRNMDVLEGIIRELPGPDKVMRLTEQQFYRIDLHISKQEQFAGGVTRNTWYFLEAPFNEGGRLIYFRAQLRNVSEQILKGGEVLGASGFDPDFGGDYRIAMVEFLRGQAMEAFMAQLLRDWEFETEREL
jgi:hypothetical protein